jgi:phage N-6-adenine-methyltransferase
MENALQIATLQELETRIKAGLETFVDVGLCLLEIRDRRLYREKGYTRFEDYCREQWGWGRNYANRQIEAAKTAQILVPMGTIPDSERQARELAPLVKADEQEAAKVWQELKEEHGDNLTAEKIRQAVKEKLKPEAPREQPSPATETADKETPGIEYVPQEERIILPESKPHVSYNTGNNEWYTPSEYIEAARNVMGEIELDPASSHKANETVKALRYYTSENDGLSKQWIGKVWMNPPYSVDLIYRFCEKLTWHYKEGDITEAIVLVNNATETNWFNILIEQAGAVVFPKGRVKFQTSNGSVGAPLQGQAIIYLGDNVEIFLSEFKHFGWGAIL